MPDNSADATLVLLNNGDGTFSAPLSYGSGTQPWAIGISDLNGDGKGDLVVTNQISNDVTVLLNGGNVCSAFR